MAAFAAGGAVDTALVATVGAVLVLPIMRRIARRRFDPFEPIVLFALAYGVMFVLRPAAMIARDSRVFVGPRETLDVSAGFTEMLVLALIGAVGFVLGYESVIGRRLVRERTGARRRLEPRRTAAVAGFIALLGLSSFGLLILSWGGLSAVGDLYRAGNEAAHENGTASMYAWFLFLVTIPATLVLLGVALERRSKAILVAALVLAVLVLAESIPIGSRITLLPFVGGIFVFLYLRRDARPRVLTLVAALVLAFLGATFLSDLRGRASRDESVADTISRATSPVRLGSALTTGPDSEMAPVLSAALSVIPEELPHTYGRTIFGDLVVRPVPRGLWPDKPELPRQNLVAAIWPIESERGTINPEFSALLYFYWDFGLVGVFLGLAAYGILAQYLYAYFQTRANDMPIQILYALALWFVVIGLRDSPVDTFVRAVFVLGPLWLIFLGGRMETGRREDRVEAPARRTRTVS